MRMTASLEIVPKGIFKPNDDNGKVIEYEEEVKIPEFGELSSAETWVHRNANVLNVNVELFSLEDVRIGSILPPPRTNSKRSRLNWHRKILRYKD